MVTTKQHNNTHNDTPQTTKQQNNANIKTAIQRK